MKVSCAENEFDAGEFRW